MHLGHEIVFRLELYIKPAVKFWSFCLTLVLTGPCTKQLYTLLNSTEAVYCWCIRDNLLHLYLVVLNILSDKCHENA